jgi:hypothetical protein
MKEQPTFFLAFSQTINTAVKEEHLVAGLDLIRQYLMLSTGFEFHNYLSQSYFNFLLSQGFLNSTFDIGSFVH